MKLVSKPFIAAVLIALACAAMFTSPAAARGFYQLNLVSDIPGLADLTDPDLVNPWGLAVAPNGNFWVADNGTGVATIYEPDGDKVPLTVTIPPPFLGSPPSAPTGEVFNPSFDFVVSEGPNSAPAKFLWATEDGTISGWAPSVDLTNAILEVDNSLSGAVYKGLAILPLPYGKSLLFAANFTGGVVEVYDADFNFVTSFDDPKIPVEFSPFGIRVINGLVYVTYALHKFPGSKDDQAGPGNGFVVVFSPKGKVVQRLISHGALNSPWGLVVSGPKFGDLGGNLLVGNFGDGRINVYQLSTGKFLGVVKNAQGGPLVIDGLWGIEFKLNPFGFATDQLFFNAGINGEADGLFGLLFPSIFPF